MYYITKIYDGNSLVKIANNESWRDKSMQIMIGKSPNQLQTNLVSPMLSEFIEMNFKVV